MIRITQLYEINILHIIHNTREKGCLIDIPFLIESYRNCIHTLHSFEFLINSIIISINNLFLIITIFMKFLLFDAIQINE